MSSPSSSRIYAQPLEDVVRVATIGRAAFGANLAKVSSLLKGDGFISMYVPFCSCVCALGWERPCARVRSGRARGGGDGELSLLGGRPPRRPSFFLLKLSGTKAPSLPGTTGTPSVPVT
jgi:hypothetical protein